MFLHKIDELLPNYTALYPLHIVVLILLYNPSRASVMASATGRPSTVTCMRACVTFNECRPQVLDRVLDATGNIGVALLTD